MTMTNYKMTEIINPLYIVMQRERESRYCCTWMIRVRRMGLFNFTARQYVYRPMYILHQKAGVSKLSAYYSRALA